MSKGIWTKHFSVDGKIYFYNAAQNRSVWVPPADSIIHEAINAKPPTYIELSGASSSYGKYSETLSEIEIQKVTAFPESILYVTFVVVQELHVGHHALL